MKCKNHVVFSFFTEEVIRFTEEFINFTEEVTEFKEEILFYKEGKTNFTEKEKERRLPSSSNA